jgi:hypothetical protein
MIELSQILGEATAAIAPSYFRLSVDGGDPVYRERVYCYELYHQMRLLWPANTPYCLNGEVDKAAHPILRTLNADHAKPDLLVHQPGDMNHNHAVIEGKSSRADADGIRKDLRTLCLFINKVRYLRAVYIVFGHEANAAMARRIQELATQNSELARIELWLHQEAGQPWPPTAVIRLKPYPGAGDGPVVECAQRDPDDFPRIWNHWCERRISSMRSISSSWSRNRLRT